MIKRISYSFGKYLTNEIEKENVVCKNLFKENTRIINKFLEMLLTKTFVENYKEDLLFSNPKSNEYLEIQGIRGNDLRCHFRKAKRISVNINYEIFSTTKAITTEINFFDRNEKKWIYHLKIVVSKEDEKQIGSCIAWSGYR